MPTVETSSPHTNRAAAQPDRIIADWEVCRRTSLSRTTLWRLRKRGEFPPKVPLSPGRGGSSEWAVQRWIRDRLAQRGAVR